MSVVTELTPMILFEMIGVVRSIATDLEHPAATTAKKGWRLEDTAMVSTERTCVASLLLKFLFNLQPCSRG